jgi:hypothetical protein
MKSNSKENNDGRVRVHVRMRPYTDDELKREGGKESTPIELFDTTNNVMVGKILY